MNITIISGSAREKALSHRVALFLKNELEVSNPENSYNILDVRDYPLNFVENVFSEKSHIPDTHSGLGSLIFDADAYILVSPEYNGSYASAMKNLMDHFPKFYRKAFGIVTYSTGALGGMRAAQQMQQMICGFFGIPCPQMLLIGNVDKKIDESGAKIDSSLDRSTETFLKEFMWLSKAVKG